MTIARHAKRTDATQKAIVDALRKIGCSVEIIQRPVDLLVWFRGRTILMDCKTPRPTNEGGAHGLTEAQKKFVAKWPGEIFFPRSPEQAVAAVLGPEAMR